MRHDQQLILLKYRLAYLADTMVNWCPALGTVLANDEVKEGYSVRGGHPVEQKEMKQWLLRVSAYADRLVGGLDSASTGATLSKRSRKTGLAVQRVRNIFQNPKGDSSITNRSRDSKFSQPGPIQFLAAPIWCWLLNMTLSGNYNTARIQKPGKHIWKKPEKATEREGWLILNHYRPVYRRICHTSLLRRKAARMDK
jgi:hypothetical protein